MEQQMSYARARLWLGITCVGTIVVITITLLLFRIPIRLLTTGADASWSDFSNLFAVMFAYAFVSGPFDFFGGYIFPKEYGKTANGFSSFLRAWFKGAFIHSALLVAIGLILINSARLGGFWLVLGAFILLSLTLLVAQGFLAKHISSLEYAPLDEETTQLVKEMFGRRKVKAFVADDANPFFTGGVYGLPGRERLVIPKLWLRVFNREQLRAILLRKQGVITSGSRARGLMIACAWNLAGFCLAYLATDDLTNVADLVTFSLWFTLWSFVGLLVLPSPSQRGVFEGDAFAADQGVSSATLEVLIKELDRNQDDEPVRSDGIERIFHPIPSVERRLAFIDNPSLRTFGAWHGARTALYLSWAGIGFLSRAVHCNCGRPDVWVFLPSD